MSLENYYLVHDDGCDYYIPLVCYICDGKKSADDLHLFSSERLKNMEDLKICQLEELMQLNRHCFLCQTCYTLIRECSNKILLIKHSPFLFNRYPKIGCLLCQDHRMVSVYMLKSNLEYKLVCKLVNRSSVERIMSICFICKEILMEMFKLHHLCRTTQKTRDNRRRGWRKHLTLKYGEATFNNSNNKISYTIEELLVLMPPQNAMSQMAHDLRRLLGIIKFITPILILNEREINYINQVFSSNRQYEFAHATDIPLNPMAAPFPNTNQDYTVDIPIGYSNVGLASNTISSEPAAVYTEQNETYYMGWENTLNNPDQNSVDQIVTYNTDNEYNTMFDYDLGTEQPHLRYGNSNENFTVTTGDSGNTNIQNHGYLTYPTFTVYNNTHLEEEQFMFNSTTLSNDNVLDDGMFQRVLTYRSFDNTAEVAVPTTSAIDGARLRNEYLYNTSNFSGFSTNNFLHRDLNSISDTDTSSPLDIFFYMPRALYLNENEFFDIQPRVVNNAIHDIVEYSIFFTNPEFYTPRALFIDEIEMPMFCNEPSSTTISETNIIDFIESLLFGTCTTEMNDDAIDIEHDPFSTNREVYTPRAGFIDENETVAILESEIASLDISTHLDTTRTNSFEEASSTADKTSTTHDVQPQGRSN